MDEYSKGEETLKIGVIGFGSIGKRHCENLISLGYRDITLLRTREKYNPLGLNEMYDENEFMSIPFDCVILANPTSMHYYFLERLISKQVNILVEKPIVCTINEVNKIEEALLEYNAIGMCAYNMRFHPCISETEKILKENLIGRIFSARFFVGQFLPSWKPDIDYRESYSAKIKLGGGVVLDLIHEIDIAEFLFGKVHKNLHSIVEKVSELEIETEDIAEIHYQTTENAIISIHLDYLTRGYSRYYEIIGERGRIICDLFRNTIVIYGDNNKIFHKNQYAGFVRNDMYFEMLKYYISCIESNRIPNTNLTSSLSSLKTALFIKNQRLYD